MNFITHSWHKFLQTQLGRVFLWMLIFLGLYVSILSAINISQVGTFEGWLTLLTSISGIGYAFHYLKHSRLTTEKDDEVISENKERGFLQKIAFNISDFMSGVFPILFLVLVLRSFLFEPFRIPSGSMLPTLHLGDFILVNKFTYGVKLPLSGMTIIPANKPKRGDIIVFRFPSDESLDYIKRVVGIPGDVVKIVGDEITINDKIVSKTSLGSYQGKQWQHVGGLAEEYKETNIDMKEADSYSILWDTSRLSPYEQIFEIPVGNYFVMGDNRSNSSDSRYWGWVPEENIKGRAAYVWLNWFDEFDWSRIGIGL